MQEPNDRGSLKNAAAIAIAQMHIAFAPLDLQPDSAATSAQGSEWWMSRCQPTLTRVAGIVASSRWICPKTPSVRAEHRQDQICR